jgi:hypothetical protein
MTRDDTSRSSASGALWRLLAIVRRDIEEKA